MNKTKLTELRRSAEYELAPDDEKCPECDFPKSYRHRYGCEFPYFKEDPSAILEILDQLEKAVEVIRSIDEHRMSSYLSTDDMLKDHLKKCGEFLASMEGKE